MDTTDLKKAELLKAKYDGFSYMNIKINILQGAGCYLVTAETDHKIETVGKHTAESKLKDILFSKFARDLIETL